MKSARPLLVLLSALLSWPVLGDEEVWRRIEELGSESARVRSEAERALIERDDPSIAAPLVELLFFSRVARPHANRILEKIFNRTVEVQKGNTYKGWFEVLGSQQQTEPVDGYLEFKARQYARIDPAFAKFLDDEVPRTIRAEEVIWGGVRKDGIPALRNPRVVTAEQASYLREDDLVFGIEVSGESRAYPRRILASHEMANDVVGGKTISISYCTLCGAAIPFDTTLGEGETYTFGTSGLLYRSNKLMYDHQTQTLWSQITGEPVWGRLVGGGKVLPVLPVTVTTWGEWRALHPDTTVLDIDTGFDRDYSGATYAGYFASPDLMFPVWLEDSRLEPKDEVLVVRLDGRVRAYPIDFLESAGILRDDWVRPITIITGRDGASRAFETADVLFRTDARGELVAADGERFHMTEEALVSRNGETVLPRVPGHLSYWFGISAQFPEIELYEPR